MIIGACQIAWLVYKADIISKVVEWIMKIPQVLARKTEQAAGGGNGGRDAGNQVADEDVEVISATLTESFLFLLFNQSRAK
jgi:hypothetical protein